MNRRYALLLIAAYFGCAGGTSRSSPTSCVNECPSAGASRCMNAEFQTCLQGGDGCFTWSEPTACPEQRGCDAEGTGCENRPVQCGDGLREGKEECDLGSANSDSEACTTGCTLASCGDGHVWDGHEQCDHGAANSDSAACTANCQTAFCGDGLVWDGVEQCDNGAANSDTGACTSQCKTAVCGDGLVQSGLEECDLGADNSDSGECTSACNAARCGDGNVQNGVEECDLGPDNADTGACTTECKAASCGDSLIEAGVEECDEGANNSDTTGGCTSACKLPVCGDGLVLTGVEQCDEGQANSDRGACTSLCRQARCGDELVQAGVEECDQGSSNSDAGECTARCTLAVCGDGLVRTGVEQCDDGNRVNGDGCNNDCRPSGALVWAQPPSSVADAWIAIAADSAGNMYLAGHRSVGSNSEVGVVGKYDASGALIWSRTFSGTITGSAGASGIGLDLQGNIVVVGSISVAPDDHYEIVVRKYDPTGNLLLSQTVRPTGVVGNVNGVNGFAIDPNGDIFLSAWAYYDAAATDARASILKVNGSTGVRAWEYQLSINGGNATGAGPVAVSSSTVFVHAYRYNAATYSFTYFLAAYIDNGATASLTWSNVLPTTSAGGSGLHDLAVDQNGDVVGVGGQEVPYENWDYWVVKYTAAGVMVWATAYYRPYSLFDMGWGVAIDSDNNVVTVGNQENVGAFEMVVRKYTSAGQLMWTQTYTPSPGANPYVALWDVAILQNDEIVVCGVESVNGTNSALLRKYTP